MSVLIKNMKVPKSCDECFVRLSLCSAARKIAKSGGPRMWVPTTYRPDDCPLAEISQPHGRLGDLDKLEKMFADIDSAPYSCFDGAEPFYSAEDAAHIIRLAPTVIDAEGNAE